jgi:ABC-type branched-subunit amino acid transport system substrate-binding protein
LRYYVVRRLPLALLCWLIMLGGASLAFSKASAQGQLAEVEVAAALPLTGEESSFGQGSLEGVRLAIEEANATGVGPRLKLATYDDHSDDAKAKLLADTIVASPAVLVLGPALSTASLAAGPVYEKGGLVSLTTTATSDLITTSRTTFRIVFKNSDQGELLATYVSRVLGRNKATIVWIDNGYGRSLRDGFARAAARWNVTFDEVTFGPTFDYDGFATKMAADPEGAPIILLTLDAEGARIVAALRRAGARAAILGNDSFGDDSFGKLLADAPEEKRQLGALTDGVSGLSPMILDSANAGVRDFANRFRRRFGHDPVWFSVAGYDAARVAIEAVRAATKNIVAPGRDQLRSFVLRFLKQLDSPTVALPALLGPMWFDHDHGRQQAIRIGHFRQGRFESAPVQLVPTTNPDTAEIASGAVFEIAPNRYVRRQRVVYTGVYLNEVSRIDLPQSRYTADFYLWLRYSGNESGADPAAVDFPDLVRGSSEGKVAVAKTALADGTVYQLWHMRGDFRNDYDLHTYPADRQHLTLRFFNAEGSSERVVYVQDHQSAPPQDAAESGENRFGGIAAEDAFRDLTQWDPVQVATSRDSLVSISAMGDPRLTGIDRTRELSGFNVSIDVQRRVVATLIKTLLPLILMSLIMYATLHFPPVLIKEKVTVAVTAALTGAVLLSSINAQLGTVGYVMAVEYVFYVFFALCLFAIMSALAGERLRNVGKPSSARVVERAGELVFVVALLVVSGVTGAVLWR